MVDSFLDKVGREIDARVDARLRAGTSPLAPPPAVRERGSTDRGQMFLAVASIALGIPITAIVLSVGSHPAGLAGLLIVWAAIAAINIAYSVGDRTAASPARGQRGARPARREASAARGQRGATLRRAAADSARPRS